MKKEPKTDETLLETPAPVVKANLIGTIIEIGISVLLCSVMVGQVALPVFYATATGSFDAYTLVLWGLFPLVVVAAILTATYNRAKYAYQAGFNSGLG